MRSMELRHLRTLCLKSDSRTDDISGFITGIGKVNSSFIGLIDDFIFAAGFVVVNNGDGMGVRAELHTVGKTAFENERNRFACFVHIIIDARQSQKRACGVRGDRQACG